MSEKDKALLKEANVVLACIAKDEDNYVHEWIHYHLKLGFDQIFVYCNDWYFESQNPKVTVYDWPGNAEFIQKSVQLSAYKDFIKKHQDYDWAAFLDVDEFLCLKKHDNIKAFIKQYEQYDCIGINWVFFGDNGLKEVKNNKYSVLKRFTRRGNDAALPIKTIVKLNKDITFENSHSPKDIKIVDTNYKIFAGPGNPKGPIDVAQINHYFVKTYQEYMENKIPKGRVSGKPNRLIDKLKPAENLFNERNLNEIKDTVARDFMYTDHSLATIYYF